MINGIDCSVPAPQHFVGQQFCGFYVGGDTPHVWTHDEVRGLYRSGVKGGLPIVVPPQTWPWAAVNGTDPVPDIGGVLRSLITQAIRWGVPPGSPLCIDIEPAQGDEMMTDPRGNQLPYIRDVWKNWCHANGLKPWWYSKLRHQAYHPNYNAWIANEPFPGPKPGSIPVGFAAMQYAQSRDFAVDLNVAANGLTWLSTNLEGTVVLGGAGPRPKREERVYFVECKDAPAGEPAWWLVLGGTRLGVGNAADAAVLISSATVDKLDGGLSWALLSRIPVAA